MTDEDKILEYTKAKFPKESKLIESSLTNFYHLRLMEEKNEMQTVLQEKLYEQVLDLFAILSTDLSDHLDIDEGVVYDKLKEIHIKT